MKTKTFKELVDGKTDTDELIKLARITEQAERYEDMCLIMGKIVEKKKELNVEERNMLSVAYKNVVGQRRASWRSLNSDQDTTAQQAVMDGKAVVKDYQTVVEEELFAKCNEVLNLLKANLLVSSAEQTTMSDAVSEAAGKGETAHKAACDTLETQVFYLKMSGDYYRYLAEFQGTEQNKKDAKTKYQEALKLSEVLAPTHPTRLGLALNASVCYWEILKEPQAACALAKKAFDDAIQKLDSLSDSTYKDSTLIMQLLRDNLTIWTTDNEQNQPAENGDA